MTTMLTVRLASAAAALLALSSLPGHAQDMTFSCSRSDVLSGDNSPMTVTYTGGASGAIKIASDRVSLTLPATKEVRTGALDGKPHSVTGITGVAEAMLEMPGKTALEACAMKSVSPDLRDDADMVALAVAECVKKVPARGPRVKAHAEVSVALVPDQSGPPMVTVEIKRRYLEASSLAGGSITIETYPGECSLSLR